MITSFPSVSCLIFFYLNAECVVVGDVLFLCHQRMHLNLVDDGTNVGVASMCRHQSVGFLSHCSVSLSFIFINNHKLGVNIVNNSRFFVNLQQDLRRIQNMK